MAARLKNRQKSIPFGFRFFQPEINFRANRNASFNAIVNALIQARAANPVMLRKNNWSLDYNAVAEEVDAYNAALCQSHGWDEFIVLPQIPTIPKALPPDQPRVVASLKAAAVAARSLVAGARTLLEWIDSNDPAVPAEQSEHRAIVCSTCPKNEAGDFTQWFTRPAAELIKNQIERAQARKLSTPRDGQLNLCTACHCPLKLKVHVPIDWIVKRLAPEQMAQLKQAPACWIPLEAERR